MQSQQAEQSRTPAAAASDESQESSPRTCYICGANGKDFCCVPCNSYIHPFCNAFRHWLRVGFIEDASEAHVDAQTKDFLAFRFVELLGLKKAEEHSYMDRGAGLELIELLRLSTADNSTDSFSLFNMLIEDYSCFSTYSFINRPDSSTLLTPPPKKRGKDFSNIVSIRSKFEVVFDYEDHEWASAGAGRRLIARMLADDELASVFIAGLESQRSDPEERLSSSANMMWDVFSTYHQEYLAETANRIMELMHEGDDQAALRKWLGTNWYCDESFKGFQQDLRTEVMLEFFSELHSWCQGTANVVCAVLGGIPQWHKVRDHMNAAVRRFRHDPDLQVNLRSTQKELERLGHVVFDEQSPSDAIEDPDNSRFQEADASAVLLYIEFDAWYRREDYDAYTWEKTYRNLLDNGKGHHAAIEAADQKISGPPGKHIGVSDCGKYVSNGGHVFVLECDAQRESFILYSSWREQYSLGKWMAQDEEDGEDEDGEDIDPRSKEQRSVPATKKFQMDATEMDAWLVNFGSLLGTGSLGPTTVSCLSSCFGLPNLSLKKQEAFLEEVWDIGQMERFDSAANDMSESKVLLWELHIYPVPFKDDFCMCNMKDVYDICDDAWEKADDLLVDLADDMMDRMDVLQWELLISERFGRRCPRFTDDAHTRYTALPPTPTVRMNSTPA